MANEHQVRGINGSRSRAVDAADAVSDGFGREPGVTRIPRQGRRPLQRIALYSHDTQGLGHVRRNSLVAAALVAAHPDTSILLLTGAPEATALPLPPRTDVVTVPALSKDRSGAYGPRAMSAPLEDILAIREAVLLSALASFAPDLLIVDKVARGVYAELDRPLRVLRETCGTTTVLGLRDVLDDVDTTTREWADADTYEAIRSLYDQIWVYGDPTVFDPAVEYGWPSSVTSKVVYTGYLARGRSQLLSVPAQSSSAGVEDVTGPFVLGLVGGGQDGASVAAAFANASFPRGHTGVLITGPYLDPQVLAELAPRALCRDDLRLLRFVADVPGFVERAAATVSMGGYNSVCELLAAQRPALLVPRTVPRMEQALRAERLLQAGLVDVLQPDALTPGRVSSWLSGAVDRRVDTTQPVDLDGFARIPDLAARLTSRRRRGARLPADYGPAQQVGPAAEVGPP